MLGKSLFFFGCRHEKQDFLYADELSEHVKAVPTDKVLVAFSRDQDKKRFGCACFAVLLRPLTRAPLTRVSADMSNT